MQIEQEKFLSSVQVRHILLMGYQLHSTGATRRSVGLYSHQEEGPPLPLLLFILSVRYTLVKCSIRSRSEGNSLNRSSLRPYSRSANSKPGNTVQPTRQNSVS